MVSTGVRIIEASLVRVLVCLVCKVIQSYLPVLPGAHVVLASLGIGRSVAAVCVRPLILPPGANMYASVLVVT